MGDTRSLKGLTQKQKEDKLIALAKEDWFNKPYAEKLLFMQLSELKASKNSLRVITYILVIILLGVYLCQLG